MFLCPFLFSFFPRWKEWEIQQAFELGFSLHDAQLSDDWTGLLNLASQPGAALEQIHVFSLAHVLRRPIVVYGVKYVKSWKGENLGYARFEGETFFEFSRANRKRLTSKIDV
jgi:ubiquitin thioesterase ZRANB1